MTELSRFKLSGYNDEQLMHRLAQGEIDSLGELYLRHGSMVKGALKRFAPELAAADIDELSQDVFLALHDSVARYSEQLKFKAWMYSIAVHKARAWRRKTWLRRNLLGQHGSKSIATALPCPTGPDTRVEMRHQVEEILGQLTQAQREVVLLHAVDGFSGEEIAEMLGVKVGVVWMRLHRARQTVGANFQLSGAKPAYEGES